MFDWSVAGGSRTYAPAYQNQMTLGLYGAKRVAAAESARVTPVPPVTRPDTVEPGSTQAAPQPRSVELPSQRQGVDPAEWAVRGRIQYAEDGEAAAAEGEGVFESKSAQEVMEEGKCQTCEERKYQDGSDDPGVSFKTPTNIAPETAAAAVRSHEQEHVSREQSKADREGREVVSQSVTIHTAICPECGKTYVSGGTTRTATRQEKAAQLYQQKEPEPSQFQSVA